MVVSANVFSWSLRINQLFHVLDNLRKRGFNNVTEIS